MDLSFLERFSSFTPTIIIVLLVVIAVVLFTKPIRFLLKLAINTALGFVALILINKFGAQFGLSMGINWINAVIVGVLGVPGVALLFVLKWLMII